MGAILRQVNSETPTDSSKIKFLLRFFMKTLLYTVFSVFIILVIGFLIYFVDKIYNQKKHTGKSPLFNAYVIVSPSMVPTIKINDAVVIFRYDPKKLKKGDIITFSSADPSYAGLTVTHRIVAKNYTKDKKCVFTTKGDHNNAEDPSLVTEEDIYGKVIFKIPKLGYIRAFLTTKLGFLIFIFLPALCIIMYDIIKLIKKIRFYLKLKEGKIISEDDLEVI